MTTDSYFDLYRHLYVAINDFQVTLNVSDPVFQSETRLWHEKNRLGEEQQLFMQQKENFERERLKFMEAVRQLDREVCKVCMDATYVSIHTAFPEACY